MAYSRSQQFNPYNQWSVDSRGREVNQLNQHKTVGYSPRRTPARSFGGLNEFYLRQQNDDPNMDIDRAAQDIRKSGDIITKDGRRVPDTMRNRGYSSRAGQNPYARPQGSTPDQQRWADKAAANKAAANKIEAGDGQAPNGLVRPEDAGSPEGPIDEGVIMGEGDGPERPDVTKPHGIGPMIKPKPVATPTRAAANPYSREGNIANAKAAGEFDDVRSKYNSDINNRGYSMDEKGGINALSKEDDGTGTSPFARARFGPRAEEIRAGRDFARGESPVRFSDPNVGPNADEMNMRPIRAEKINPYGTATATLTPVGSPARPGGTMTDPLTGKTVPMKQWAADQSAVQATKYGSPNPNKVPLGQDDAEQYRNIARGGKMTGGGRSRA